VAITASSDGDRREAVITCLFLTCGRLHYLRRTLAAIRHHFREVEPEIPVSYICLDNGSAPDQRAELIAMGFDSLILNLRNLGIGPAMNQLVSQVRSPWFLNLQDDWEVRNPSHIPFIREALSILEGDERLGHLKMDDCHFLDFTDRTVYDGPFHAREGGPAFYVQDPSKLWGGFCFPPALTKTAVIHQLGPFREDQSRRRGWAESEYTQRYAARFLAAKSPQLTIFHHIGDEATHGWDDRGTSTEVASRQFSSVKSQLDATPRLRVDAKPSLTFVVPFSADSPERVSNLELVRAHLEGFGHYMNMSCGIIVQEPNAGSDDKDMFNRSATRNDGVRACSSDIVALNDADVLIPYAQMAEAYRRLSGEVDYIYPYEGAFLNIPRHLFSLAQGGVDEGQLLTLDLPNLNPGSVGGSVWIRRSCYWAAGGMNEHFRSWGREDVEFDLRLGKLGYHRTRVSGPLFHLDHPRTVHGTQEQPYFRDNELEYRRIEAMNRYELLDEIATWKWSHV
jgi:GT2 family glycosyltransferase